MGTSRRTCPYGVWIPGLQPSCRKSEAVGLSVVPRNCGPCILLVRTVECSSLSNPSNGRVRVIGNIATYSCNAGFRLSGNSRRTCTYGVWYPKTAPSCDGSNNVYYVD